MASETGPATADNTLRVFFIPFFASGHMIPLVDIAYLFSSRGVDTTILLTPANAALVKPTVDRAAAQGFPIHTLLYPFPSPDVTGLPPGVETLGAVPRADTHKFDAATPLVAREHDRLLRHHRPHAVVSDAYFPWTSATACELGIPRISFHSIGLFDVIVMNELFTRQSHVLAAALAEGSDEPFLVSGIPDPVYISPKELPDYMRRGDAILADAMQDIQKAEASNFGIVTNSFAEIESHYADYYYEHVHMKTWFVGPVALATAPDKDSISTAARGCDGPIAAANRSRCMEFLNTKASRSVMYVSFGSWCHFSGEQLRELALGLEMAGHPFVWVVRVVGIEEEKKWMPEGYEERVKDRGLVIRGWAPQVVALSHEAVGGFVSHCGWNSALEGLGAGLPMVTWPLNSEQFINEKLLVVVMKVAVKAEEEGRRGADDVDKVVVTKEEVAKAVKRVMGGGEEAEERRRRARRYGEMAKAAVEKGGSSYEGLSRLIEDIRAWPDKDHRWM